MDFTARYHKILQLNPFHLLADGVQPLWNKMRASFDFKAVAAFASLPLPFLPPFLQIHVLAAGYPPRS